MADKTANISEQIMHVKLARQWMQGFAAAQKNSGVIQPNLPPEEYLRRVEVFLHDLRAAPKKARAA